MHIEGTIFDQEYRYQADEETLLLWQFSFLNTFFLLLSILELQSTDYRISKSFDQPIAIISD